MKMFDSVGELLVFICVYVGEMILCVFNFGQEMEMFNFGGMMLENFYVLGFIGIVFDGILMVLVFEVVFV